MNIATISPVPTHEEAAAITAAITMMWPQPVALATNESPVNLSWRFSGRWWADSSFTRHRRPGQ